MLAMGPSSARSGDWQVPVLTSCALSGDGVVGLLVAIDGHRAALDACGAMAARRADINARRLFLAGEGLLRDAMSRQQDGRVIELIALLDARVLGPHAAAKRLLADIRDADGARARGGGEPAGPSQGQCRRARRNGNPASMEDR